MARAAVAVANLTTLAATYTVWFASGHGGTVPTFSAVLRDRKSAARVYLIVGFCVSAVIAIMSVGVAGPLGIFASLLYVNAVQTEPWHTIGGIAGFTSMIFTASELGAFDASVRVIQMAAVVVVAAVAWSSFAGHEGPLELGGVLASSIMLLNA